MEAEKQNHGKEIAREILTEVIEGMLADGMSEKFIAQSLNISRATVRKVKNKYR